MKMKTTLSGFFAVLCFTTILTAQIPTGGLIASYPFNGNANDESGNGNNANFYLVTFTNDRCGISNSACYFNGIDNYISLPPDQLIDLNEYTYSLWIEVNSLPSPSIDGWIMLAIGSSTESYEQAFSIHPDGSLFAGSYNIGNNPLLTMSQTSPVDTSNWVHGVMIRDSARLRIYVNGNLVVNLLNSADTLINNQPANYGSEPHYAIIGGRSNLTSHNFFLGKIDDVRIYNRALSDEEVLRLYYTKCMLSEINGEMEVCQGQQQVPFYVQPLENATNYEWSYSGYGETIHGEGDSISIDFSENATSGSLTLTVTGNGMEPQSRSVPVFVYSIPSAAGIIAGDNEVCQNQNGIPYTVPIIEDATGYVWNYSGGGASISGSSNSITIDFSENATNGNLTVTARNVCGYGQASAAFPITIISRPAEAGTINGDKVVCANQENVQYSIFAIQNTTGYLWHYSGSGVTISGNSNSISVDFSDDATSGNLTVSGENNCGSGNSSVAFPVTVTGIPGKAGAITGVNETCQNQKDLRFSIPSIENATDYVWNYSGTGATIRGSSESVVVSFSSDATTGNLTVFGNNTCGNGIPSTVFPITVSSCSEYPPDLNIPNSFSPNGDGKNDVFFIRGLTENSTLLIFDRDGNKLFESFNYQNDWDGKDKKGHVLESGTYWYVFTLSGSPAEHKGFVYLKR